MQFRRRFQIKLPAEDILSFEAGRPRPTKHPLAPHALLKLAALSQVEVSNDLPQAFPDMTGFSPRNLRDTKRFYLAYADEAIWRQAVAKLNGGETIAFLRQLVAEIPWGQNLLILNKLKAPAARLYYLRATARFGWSRNVLLNQIKAGAYERSLKAGKSHNFPAALPAHLAEQAEEALKSSYNLEFLGIGGAVRERELEDRLVGRLRDFILELGSRPAVGWHNGH